MFKYAFKYSQGSMTVSWSDQMLEQGQKILDDLKDLEASISASAHIYCKQHTFINGFCVHRNIPKLNVYKAYLYSHRINHLHFITGVRWFFKTMTSPKRLKQILYWHWRIGILTICKYFPQENTIRPSVNRQIHYHSQEFFKKYTGTIQKIPKLALNIRVPVIYVPKT